MTRPKLPSQKTVLAVESKVITVVLTYLLHLLGAWLISWGLRHGFHFQTGYIGLSFLTYFGPMPVKLVLKQLGSAWGYGVGRGQYVAEKEAVQEQVAQLAKSEAGMHSLLDMLGVPKDASTTAATSPADLVGNYL